MYVQDLSIFQQEVLRELHDVAPNLEVSELQKLVSFGMAVLASDSTSSLPDFPIDNLRSVAQMMVSLLALLYESYKCLRLCDNQSPFNRIRIPL